MKIEINERLAKSEGVILPFWSMPNAGAKGKSVLPPWAQDSFAPHEFTGAPGQTASLRLPAFGKKKPGNENMLRTAPDSRIVLFLGLGEKNKCNPHALIASYANALNALKSARCKSVALLLPAGPVGMPPDGFVYALASQLTMADYAFDKYKSREKDSPPKPAIETLLLVPAPPAKSSILPALRAALARGVVLGEAANFTRSIQNEPSNVATPAYVADQARKMAKASSLKCTVLSKPQMEKEKMNALLSVASGSDQEPRLVLLEYRGNPSKKGWDAALVGKGVTFDSGGISIKPAQKMDAMKFDKSGACAAIGALSACSKLGLKLNVVGVAALVENMPSGKAYKPGDIVTACNGQTIEVLNTDAEGRVVLSDALAYTSKKYDPAVMIDFATLTGACVVALGDLASGILSEDDSLVLALTSSGERVGERLWRLPLWPEYDEKVKSEIASLKNTGESGQAGTTAGASFLKSFVGERAWAHIDIAGTADSAKSRAGLCPGGTGVGVRLSLDYLLNFKAPKEKKK
ncbi:MAG: leucyl aminopeptidase [Candidatus Micrarchaeota archaeon]